MKFQILKIQKFKNRILNIINFYKNRILNKTKTLYFKNK